jgi:hypothetical protein
MGRLRSTIQRSWIFNVVRNDPRELTALEQFAPLPASTRHLVFRSADCLLAAAARLDAQQIAVTTRRDEAEHVILITG